MNAQNTLPIGRLFKVEADNDAWVELDSARVALLIFNMNAGCSQAANIFRPVKKCLNAVRWTGVRVIHILENDENIHPDFRPIPGEKVVGNADELLKKLGITHVVVTGIDTSDYDYCSIVLGDCTTAADFGNYLSCSERFIRAVDANLKPIACC